MIGRICGTGSYAPADYMDNDDLAKIVDTNDEWIRERTGIRRRHIAKKETTVSMAAKAAETALENGKILPEEVEMILVATFSSNALLPSTACQVQREIGAVNAVCFDLNAACTGFLFAYNTAQSYIAAGLYKTVLVIGAESLSNLVDWTDRGTCILFGDGAGAVALQAEEGKMLPMTAHSNGGGGSVLTCEGQGMQKKYFMQEEIETLAEEAYIEKEGRKENDIKRPDVEQKELCRSYIQMDGRRVFEFAVRKVPEVIEELLEEAGLSKEDISLFVLHQANERIVASVAKRLGTDMDKFPMNLSEYGNTSAASIPLLLDELNKEGRIRRGDYLVLAGFGAGLSWGATLVKW